MNKSMKHALLFLLCLVVGSVAAQDPGSQPQPSATPYFVAHRPPLVTPGGVTKPITIADRVLDTLASRLDWATSDLRVSNETYAPGDLTYVHFKQYFAGEPVLGGKVVVAVATDGSVRSVSGSRYAAAHFRPAAGPGLPTDDPALAAAAKRALLPDHPYATDWTATYETTRWASPDPWQPAHYPLRRCYVFRVGEPAGNEAYRVYVDAATGHPVFRQRLGCDLSRELYTGSTASGNLRWAEGQAFPGSLTAEDQELLLATAETYHLFRRTFGRDSYDGTGGTLTGVTDAALSNCPNARAFSSSIRVCNGVVADDVVAHEWTHVYLNGLNDLLLEFESGSINEAYADVFGELVDLLNDRGLDTNDDQVRTGCNDGNLRWIIAEDATALDSTLRDLYQPECKTDPDSRDSPLFDCTTGPGYLHTNSGPIRHLFTLLADGGTHEQDTIAALGLTRAAHLFYYVAEHLMTPVTDFEAFGRQLELAANALVGAPLPELTLLDLPAAIHPDTFDLAAVTEVVRAVRSLGLPDTSVCPRTPVLQQSPPGTCDRAPLPAFVPILSQDWEDAFPDWTTSHFAVDPADWTAPDWAATEQLPDGRGGQAMFVANTNAGDCELDSQAGLRNLTSPTLTLPVTETDFVLSFEHYFAVQVELDGGILTMSRNGGNFAAIGSQAFLYNGYTERLTSGTTSDNPLAGRLAYTGSDAGSTTGTWGRTLVDLTAAGALPGDEIRLRWVFGQNGCTGRLGWYVDEVRIGFCGAAVLPVNWLSFTATVRGKAVELVWATATERNNRGFTVERREGNGTFSPLGFVAAGADYRYTDAGVRAGGRYVYRLRQEDTDGTMTYSPLVEARLPLADLLVYPNPARNGFYLSTATAGPLRIYDATGRLVHQRPLPVGEAHWVATDGLKPGVYLLRLGVSSRRIVLH